MLEENNITDGNKLKEELLQEIRLSEDKLLKKINEQSSEISRLNNENLSKYELITNKSESILNTIVEQKMKFEKIDEFEMFKKKIDDMIITHEIRINNSLNEIGKMKTKYDKIFTDNLTISGYVGPACQYKSIGEYIYFNINDINKLKSEKEYIKKELKDTKSRMDSLMATTLSLVNGTVNRCNEYCNEGLKNLNKNISKSIKEIFDKIENLENLINNVKDESDIKIDVLSKEIKDFSNKMEKMKNDYIDLIEQKTKIFPPQIFDINKNITSLFSNFELLKTTVQNCDLKTTNFDNLIKDIRGKYVKMFNDFYLNPKISNLINSPISDRKNTPEEKNLKTGINNNNNSINLNSHRSLENIKISENNNNNDKKVYFTQSRNKEKSKQKINTKENIYSDNIINEDENLINEECNDSEKITEQVRMKSQMLDQINEKNKEKEKILISIDQNNKIYETNNDSPQNKKNEGEMNIFNNKLKNISNKSSSQIIKKKHNRNSTQNLIFNKNSTFVNTNKKCIYNFNTLKEKEKLSVEIPYLTNNNNTIFTSSYKNINNSKINISENKLNKNKISTDVETVNSIKLLNRNDIIIDSYTNNNSHNKININQDNLNSYKLASLGYESNYNYNNETIETYSLAAKYSNNIRSVSFGESKQLNSMKFSGFKYHRTNSNDKMKGEIPYKIGSIFGRTVYYVYDQKEEKYKNLLTNNKSGKIKKSPGIDKDLNISLVPVAKIKINV